jgi:hypothetical protein
MPNKGGLDWGYSWVPVVGPTVGRMVRVIAYVRLVWTLRQPGGSGQQRAGMANRE